MSTGSLSSSNWRTVGRERKENLLNSPGEGGKTESGCSGSGALEGEEDLDWEWRRKGNWIGNIESCMERTVSNVVGSSRKGESRSYRIKLYTESALKHECMAKVYRSYLELELARASRLFFTFGEFLTETDWLT